MSGPQVPPAVRRVGRVVIVVVYALTAAFLLWMAGAAWWYGMTLGNVPR